MNDTRLEPYGSSFSSRLEGMWGIVDGKAGGLADAQHSPRALKASALYSNKNEMYK